MTCVPGTRLAAVCGTAPFAGFHYCRYGLARALRGRCWWRRASSCRRARPTPGVEGIELPAHPFFLATLFQPQVGALAGNSLHPLIGAFLDAARRRRGRLAPPRRLVPQGCAKIDPRSGSYNLPDAS